MPTISVLMTAHNAASYIRVALDSVLAQKDADFEAIIVDDGSRDETPDILRRYADADARIRPLFLEENKGQTLALNDGIVACRGDYIARLDADDVCLDGRLARQAARMAADNAVVFVGCGARRISASGRDIGDWHAPPADHDEFVARLRSFGPVCPHSGFFLRRSSLEAVGGYDPLQRRAQDFDLLLRLSEAHGARFAAVDAPLIGLRMHSENLSYGKGALLQTEQAMGAMVRHRIRLAGRAEPGRENVEAAVRAAMAETGLDGTLIAQRRMVNAFLAFRNGDYGKFALIAARVLTGSPLDTLRVRRMAQMKADSVRLALAFLDPQEAAA